MCLVILCVSGNFRAFSKKKVFRFGQLSVYFFLRSFPFLLFSVCKIKKKISPDIMFWSLFLNFFSFIS